MSGIRVTAALLAATAAMPALAGCTTTQERSARLAEQAEDAAAIKAFNVGKTNAVIKVRQTVTIPGPDANAVVVRVENTSSAPQVLVPIGVDLYDEQGESFFTNRVDGLDAPLNNLPLAEPGESWWVNNQLPAQTASRTRVRVGTSRTDVPAQLPELRVSGVKLDDDDGTPIATGKVENLSTVEQRRLTLFAVALKGEKVVAAGRAVVDRLPAKGRPQRFNVYFNGDPTGAKLEISAPPSTLEGA